MEHNKPFFPGAMVISLDFELHWGLLNSFTLAAVEEMLLGAREAVISILDLFQQYEIHATWAVVGFLFCQTKQQLLAALPQVRPSNDGQSISPYDIIGQLGPDEDSDPYHYASSLVDRILGVSHQELATHTFSHFVWNGLPSDSRAFQADLRAALEIGLSKGVNPANLVFPQNKYSRDLLKISREEGIKGFRGKRKYWYTYFDKEDMARQTLFRLMRLLDHHVSLSGSNTYTWESIIKTKPYNISASWPLEFFSRVPLLSAFEPLRLKRIKSSLSSAAEEQKIFHLWWHPYQFGEHTAKKIDFLRRLLDHFAILRESCEIESLTMKEVVERCSLLDA